MSAPTYSTSGCAFTLDVQWILDVVDRVKQCLERIGSVGRQVLAVAQRFLDALSAISDVFCWIPGVGKFAKSVVEAACAMIERTVDALSRGIQSSLEAFKHVLAPWEVRSAGSSIVNHLAPRCQDLALQYQPGQFASSASWTGAAADAFFSALAHQKEAAEGAAEGAQRFGEAVEQMGAKGVDITVSFVTQYLSAAIGIITAATEMAVVPVGTAVGAAQVVALIGSIITYVMVWITAMLTMISSMSEMSSIAREAVPGGSWPVAVLA